MISTILGFIEGLFQTYGAIGVFVGAILEEIVAPIPSSVVMMGAGFSLVSPSASTVSALLTVVFMVAIPAALGVTIGSLAVYALGFYLGQPFIERYGAYLGISTQALMKARSFFGHSRIDEITIVGLRTIPLIPSVALSALCGIIRIPLPTYLVCTAIGSFFRATALGIVGWQAQDLYTTWATEIDHLELYLMIPVVIAILVVIGIKLTRTRQHSYEEK